MHYRFTAIKSCQSLRRYQKTKNFLPKPEEVPKKPKKTKIFSHWLAPGLKIGKSLFFLVFLVPFQVLAVLVLVFLVPPQVLAIKWCQSLRRYQKNQKLFAKPEEVPKKPKKPKIFSHWLAPGLKIGKSLVFFVFLVPFQVLAVLVLVFLVPPQVLAIKWCQSLRRYQKKPKTFCQNLKRYQKNKKNQRFSAIGWPQA